MFDRFGEFDSAEEINETAVNLRREGDLQGLRVPPAGNGIDADDEEAFAAGALLYLCDDMAAAIGKIEIEAKGVDCAEIMEDWVDPAILKAAGVSAGKCTVGIPGMGTAKKIINNYYLGGKR